MTHDFKQTGLTLLMLLGLLVGPAGCDQAETDSDEASDTATQRDEQTSTQDTADQGADPAVRSAAPAKESEGGDEPEREQPSLDDQTRKLIAKVITQAQGSSRAVDSLIQGFVGLTDEKLHTYGEMGYEEQKKSGKLLTEGPYVERAQKLGKQVLALGERDFPYTLTIVESDAINAFATAGGYVYLHTALMDALDDEQLIFVIGHEVGHIELKHTDSIFTYADRLGLFAGDNAAWVVAALLSQHVSVGYSEKQELESDAWGLINTKAFGVTPDDAIETFEILAKSSGESLDDEQEPDDVLEELEHQRAQHYKTHPASRERIEQIKRLSKDN